MRVVQAFANEDHERELFAQRQPANYRRTKLAAYRIMAASTRSAT
jgi:ATP-binding cassette subfamily B protein